MFGYLLQVTDLLSEIVFFSCLLLFCPLQSEPQISHLQKAYKSLKGFLRQKQVVGTFKHRLGQCTKAECRAHQQLCLSQKHITWSTRASCWIRASPWTCSRAKVSCSFACTCLLSAASSASLALLAFALWSSANSLKNRYIWYKHSTWVPTVMYLPIRLKTRLRTYFMYLWSPLVSP